MKSKNWKAIAESVGVIAVVASLVFVGLQIRQEQRVAAAQINLTALESNVAVEAAMAEHASVWVKAQSQQDLTEAEIRTIQNLVRMAEYQAFLGSLATLRVRASDSLVAFEETPGQVMNFVILLHENPGARQIWAEAADREDQYLEKTSTVTAKIRFNALVRDFLGQLQN